MCECIFREVCHVRKQSPSTPFGKLVHIHRLKMPTALTSVMAYDSGHQVFLNLRATSWDLSHMNGNKFAKLYRNNKLSQLNIIISDTDDWKDTDHVLNNYQQ